MTLRSFLSSLVLLTLTTSAVAQEHGHLTAPRRVSSDYIALGYCGGNIQYSVALTNGAPTKAAIAITRGMLGAYRNAQIVGVRVGLAASANNVSGWIIDSGDFNSSVAETSPTYAYKDQGWQDLIFRTPYEFSATQGDNTTLIVGYTSTGDNQVGFDGETEVNNYGNFMWNGSRGWGSMATTCRNNGYGNCCIQVLLGGVDIPTADMAINSLITRHAEQGQAVTLQGIVTNKVPTPVTSYTMAYSINGSQPKEVRIVQNVNSGEATRFSLELPPFTSTGAQDITLSITSVNGEEDVEPKDNTLHTTIESVERGGYFPQVHVIEESTNLGCGWCPRGIVVMESMEQRHPDRFIGIAAHSDVTTASDPLYVPAYYNELAWLYADESTMAVSEPNGIMNRDRSLCGDPLFWDGYFDAHEWDLSEAGLWIEKASAVHDKSIDVNLQCRFRHDHNSHPYRLAFVLTEDNVSGYRQSNYYAGGTSGVMGGWEARENPCRVALHRIARGIWQHGTLDSALPTSLQALTDYPVSYTMDLSDTSIQSNDNLRIVAFLLDNTTGHIIQAAQIPVGTSNEGILQPTTDNGQQATNSLHDLQGRRVASLRHIGEGTVLLQNGQKILQH